MPGNYDGSGKAEFAVYIPSLGAYFYRPANGGADVEIRIGVANSGEVPAPGDYDGSGRTEAAIYDPSTGYLLYQPAKGGSPVPVYIGSDKNGAIAVAEPAGDLPEFAGLVILAPSVKAEALVPSTTAPASASVITLSSSARVPGGPTLASIRVARSLVNQAALAHPFEVG